MLMTPILFLQLTPLLKLQTSISNSITFGILPSKTYVQKQAPTRTLLGEHCHDLICGNLSKVMYCMLLSSNF